MKPDEFAAFQWAEAPGPSWRYQARLPSVYRRRFAVTTCGMSFGNGFERTTSIVMAIEGLSAKQGLKCLLENQIFRAPNEAVDVG
jgi:hypothetical protein